MQINIIYFTSTGNTLWLATKAKEIIEHQGHEVKLYEVIKDGEDFIKDKCDMLGVFYPVWDFLPAVPLWDFLQNKLPEGKKKKMFFIGDCAGIAGDASMMCKKLMDSKGYDAFYFNHIIMPTNLVIPWLPFNLWKKAPTEKQLENYLSTAEKRLRKICESVLNFETRFEATGVLWNIAGRIQRICGVTVNYYKKSFCIAEDKCADCGFCTRICPTNNINKNMDGKIVFGYKCIMCAKCYNLCPKDAVLIGKKTINLKKYTRYKGPGHKIKPVLYRK